VTAADGDREPLVIRDNRKIDPVTGEARKPASAADAMPATESGEGPMVDAALLDERTRDLQRVQAEYANYRKRAEREKQAAGDLAVGRALGELLPVLDDIDRARAHGDLTGALKSVADHLDAVFGKLGLEAFGEVGDPFDPAIHEAVLHAESDTVTEPTCTTIMRPGYKHNGRLVRAAMVGVTDPLAPPGLGDTTPVTASAEGRHAAAEADSSEDQPDETTSPPPPTDDQQG
jgi:molecular chaperone GrpE